MKHHVTALALASFAAAACGDSDKSDADFQADVVVSMHDSIALDLDNMVSAAQQLQAAAPSHAWSETADATAIDDMRMAWKNTRTAYEHVEGATAPIFGNLDITLDARYDDYLAKLGDAGDTNLFDDKGVTGMHGIERILYALDIRDEVIDFEEDLPGYQPAAYPATTEEAMSFKNVLCQKLVDDAKSLRDQWQPAAIDIGAAYQGLVGLMNEQKEKVNLAATGEEESRYANLTLFDLRNNLDGTLKVYDLFGDWIHSKPDGTAPDSSIQQRLAGLKTLYNTTSGDSLPPVPEDWSSDAPTPANLATPFGVMWSSVHQSVDPNTSGSVVFEMNQIAVLLGFDEFVEEE
jgi:iron uptake system component EfeO